MMSWRGFACVLLAVLLASVATTAAIVVASSQPKAYVQVKNPYYPFTVELSVRDR